MKKTQVVIVGAGPAGLAAAIEAARAGAQVLVLDENPKPGGQLFKQIHKFFGSWEHKAGIRGYRIGAQLLKETEDLGVEVFLNAPVYGVFRTAVEGAPPPPHPPRRGNEIPPDLPSTATRYRFLVSYMQDEREQAVECERLILATGATENALAFPGNTLPGVMGAGCAQTMINVNRVLPGRQVLMIGSGNVGLIVSYQLLQAGAALKALIEAAPAIGGYGVHAAKLRRAGVPILVSHTITRARGGREVEAAEVVELDDQGQSISGTEKVFAVDTICVAVGLSPLTELAWMAGCEFTWAPVLGGHIPLHNDDMETTIDGLYAAGDITGSEEASTAMEEGRLAGLAAAESLRLMPRFTAERLKAEVWYRMNALRTGPFGQKRAEAKNQILELANRRRRS